MYRTAITRHAKNAQEIPELTDDKIDQLTSEQRVDIYSRMEMLQALAGYRWVGEASHDVHSKEPTEPTAQQTIALTLLKNLGLAARLDWLERSKKYYSWVQFAINEPMLDMFMDKNHPFNVIEEGAVYGYPISSTLAFAGVIPQKRVREKSVAEYFVFGVNSEKYYDREVEYAQKIWEHLCNIAPALTNEAHEDYKKIAKVIAVSPQV